MASSHADGSSAGAQAIPVRPGTEKELPNIQDLAITPGGMHFLGTTPGGTRIIYDRNTLMHYRNSPLSKTPPAGFPAIPGVTAGCPAIIEEEEGDEEVAETPVAEGLGLAAHAPEEDDDNDVFPMD